MKWWKQLTALCALMLAAVMMTPAYAAEVPYYAQIEQGSPIFTGPGYGYSYAGVVEEAGVYTIMVEVQDENGILWGYLKSGRGWVMLEENGYQDAASQSLISVSMAQQPLPLEDVYYRYVQEASEYTVWLTFTAGYTVTNVQFVSFAVADAGLQIDQVLYSVQELKPDMPLETGVVFYGDMTSYGLLCTDSDGFLRCFIVSISGYDGSLIVEEYDVIAMPAAVLG